MLSSWKEIAHFFGKGVRTVQRWEKTLDLPIHRPPGAPSNVVLARTSDLEDWMHRGPVARAVSEEATAPPASAAVVASIETLELEVARLVPRMGLSAAAIDSSLSAEDRITALSVVLNQVNANLDSERTARAA